MSPVEPAYTIYKVGREQQGCLHLALLQTDTQWQVHHDELSPSEQSVQRSQLTQAAGGPASSVEHSM